MHARVHVGTGGSRRRGLRRFANVAPQRRKLKFGPRTRHVKMGRHCLLLLLLINHRGCKRLSGVRYGRVRLVQMRLGVCVQAARQALVMGNITHGRGAANRYNTTTGS